MDNTQGTVEKGKQPFDLSKYWIQVAADDAKRIEQLEKEYGLDFKHNMTGNTVWETDTFIYMPFPIERRDGDTVSTQRIVFAISDKLLVTVQPSVPFDLFDQALVRMRRLPSHGDSPHAIMCSLLSALNDSSDRVVRFMSDVLDNMAEDIHESRIGQRKATGRLISDFETKKVSLGLHECEKVLSRAQDSQLSMIRAAVHLKDEVVGNPDLRAQVGLVASDIQSVETNAGFEQRKIRFLQRSMRTALDQKQGGIIKIFSIITAVFLPPSLIATFYSMNFFHMPELRTMFGVPITVGFTFLVGMMPFAYMVRSKWLR